MQLALEEETWLVVSDETSHVGCGLWAHRTPESKRHSRDTRNPLLKTPRWPTVWPQQTHDCFQEPWRYLQSVNIVTGSH